MLRQVKTPSQPGRFARSLIAACCAGTLLGVVAPAAMAADPGETTGPATASRPNVGTELVLRALELLGVNYRWGGNTPEAGLDCSGLVRHVFQEAVGVIVPRRSVELSRTGERVQIDQLKPGDLVFFNTLRRAYSHVGIYIGNNEFVHAPSTGRQVRIDNLGADYWTRRFDGARRLVEPSQPAAVNISLRSSSDGRTEAGRDASGHENHPEVRALDQLLGALEAQRQVPASARRASTEPSGIGAAATASLQRVLTTAQSLADAPGGGN